jgi:site-specific recombinase XerD
MGTNSEYNRSLREQKRKKLHDLEKNLPRYALPFLDEKELTSQINTCIAYAGDLHTFFGFLTESNPLCKNLDPKDVPASVLEQLTFEDINEYQRYLSYSDGEFKHLNEEKGIARRMSALRGFFEYGCTHNILQNNPTVGAAKRRKMHKKDIIRMNSEEVNQFLDTVRGSKVATDRQKSFCEKTKYRDTAILTLLLHTGIRVSECVGLDLEDINFKEHSFSVVRKGGNTANLYFNEEVAIALQDYINLERPHYIESDKEKALFLSSRKQRMQIRSIQQMVRKYAKIAVPDKKISPHKMRSTYGTALYQQTGDIRLVADVLGHKDINTTAQHYAAMEEEHRKQAAKIDPYMKTAKVKKNFE